VEDYQGNSTCRTSCFTDGFCEITESCVSRPAESDFAFGGCLENLPCSIFEQDCPQGFGCYHEGAAPPFPRCVTEGHVPEGESCARQDGYLPICEPGTMCTLTGVGEICTRYCDPESNDPEECPPDNECAILKDFSGFHVCIPLPPDEPEEPDQPDQ
jgi:hypothetical protein